MSLYLSVEQDCLPKKFFKFSGFEQEYGRDNLGLASDNPVERDLRVFVINNNYYYQNGYLAKAKLISNYTYLQSGDCLWKFLPIPEPLPIKSQSAFCLDLNFGFLSRQVNLIEGKEYILGKSAEADIGIDLIDIPAIYFKLIPHTKTIRLEMINGMVLVNSRKVFRSARLKRGDLITLMPLGIKANISSLIPIL